MTVLGVEGGTPSARAMFVKILPEGRSFCKHGSRACVFSTQSIDCCKFVVLELCSTHTQHIHNNKALKSVDTQPKLNTMEEIGKQEYEMDKPTHLDALASPPSDIGVKRTKTGRLRELLPQIEAAQAAGYANTDIAQALTRQGLEIDKKTLETILYRIRKEIGEKSKNLSTVSKPNSQTFTQPEKVKNPLKDSKGFEFSGTQSKDQLI